MTRRRFAAAATAFRIWRAGTSVKWDCTAAEIAAETGLHVTTVRQTCAARGWPVQPAPKGATGPAVDRYIKRGSALRRLEKRVIL